MILGFSWVRRIGSEFIGLSNLGLGLKGFGSLSFIDWVKDLFGYFRVFWYFRFSGKWVWFDWARD